MEKRILQQRRALRTALIVLLLSVVGMMKMHAITRATIGDLVYDLYGGDYAAVVVGHVDGQSATGNLDIPSTVTWNGSTYWVRGIGGNAFRDCSGLTGTLTIPNTVYNIEGGSFYGCSGFTELVFSQNPQYWIEIGNEAFAYCTGFTDLILSDHVQVIGSGAFAGCTGITIVSIPNSVIEMDHTAFNGTGWYNNQPNGILYLDGWCMGYKGAEPTGALNIAEGTRVVAGESFEGCIGITALTLPNSLKKIGKSAFSGCTGITGELIIPNSATYILENAFSRCTGFTGDLVIPDSVIYLGSCAFDSCSGFTGSLTLSNSLKKLKEGVFRGCSGFTGSLVIPNSVTQIGERQYAGTGTFEGCSGFTGSLTIGDSVTMIGRNAFNGCSGFTGELVIPDAVRDVGMYAFSGCSGFSGSLTLGASIDWVFCSAFRDCTGITTLNFNATQSGAFGVGYPAGGYFFWDGSPFEGCTSLTTLNIGDNVLTIPWCAFYGFNGFVGELVIPNSVTSIGDNAFSGCTGFTGDLVIPNSVTSIEKNAFWGCSSFTGELTLSNSLISIKEYSFEGCSGFTGELVIPSSVNDIGERAFHNCSGLTSVVIGDTTNPVEPITTIGAEAFLNCSALTSAVFGNSGSKIGDYAFHNCSSLTSVVIGDTINPVEPVTTIGASAFRDCTELTSIIIGNTVISIGPSAFYNTGYRNNHEDGIIYTPGNWCIGRKGVPLTDTLQLRENTRGIAGNVFNGCSGLTYVSFPDSLISIGVNAFMNCTGLTSVTIPSSMRFIGKRALCGCTGLTDLYFNAANCEIEEGRVVENNHWVYTYYWLYDCPSLSTVTLGDSVQVLSGNAFGACSSVTLLNVLAETPPLVTSLGDLNHDIPVHVPCGSLLAYQTIPIWNDFANIQQDNTCVFDITLIARGEEGGTVNGGGIYTSYQDCTMTAEANSGYVFTKWTRDGHIVSYNPSYTIVVTEDATYEAHFKPNSVSAHYYTNSEDPYCPYVCVSWTKANHAFFENYESGDFSSNDWQLDQTYPWSIYSAYPYEGRYCMKSGGGNYYTNNIQSTMQITVDIPKNGSISFAYKISSEENYDGCAFYIDDQEMGFYSGLSGWKKKIYPITAGEHTLKWVYRKNQSRYRYDDCVYIDCIEFEGDGWYAYDNGVSVNVLGTGGGNIYWGVMFPPGSYEGNLLTKVSAYDAVAMQGNVTIYNGGTFSPTNPVGQRDISFTGVEDFVEFEFDTPVAIDPTKSVWVVFYNGSGTGYPAAVCNDTGDANGRWVNIDGNAWEDVKSYGLDYTFMVRAFITDGASGEYIAPMGLTTDWVAAQPTNSERGALRSRSGEISNGNVNQPFGRSIRSLAPYYVYRANCEGGEMQLVADNVYESRFVDSAWAELPAGTYHYGICLENNASNIVWSNCIEKPDVSDTCVVKFDLFHPNGGGSSWFGNYLVVNYGGNTEILTKPGWVPVSYSIAMPKGCHVHLGWIYGNWTNSCGFTVSYENDNVIYSGSNIGDHGLAYEFVVDCDFPTYEITVLATPEGCGSVAGGGVFYEGVTCTLTATPVQGFFFSNWTCNDTVVSTTPTYSFTVTGDALFVAHFVPGIILGEGTYTSPYLPSFSGFDYTLSQQIYTSSEIGIEGNITHLSFFNDGSTKTRSYNIYMVHTDKTTFESTTDWIVVTEADLVFSGTVTMIQDCWTTFALDTPFSYNGLSNLALIVDDNSGNGSSSPQMDCRIYRPGGYQAIRIHSTYNDFDPYNPSSYDGVLDWGKNQIILSFNLESYTINATVNPTEGGTVSGAGTYIQGATCVLAASAHPGYAFVNWTKDGEEVSTNATYTFTVTENADYVANFTQTYTITTSANPTAGGTVSGGGNYIYNETCTLTASANAGYTFVNWTKNSQQVSTSATYSFTVTESGNYVANFSLNSYTITVTASPSNGGMVSGGGSYNHGSSCTLTASPNTGYTFTNWTKNGEIVSTEPIYTFIVTEPASYMANFDLGYITQSTDFTAGWNWWNTYIEQEGIDGLAQLEESLDSHGVQIKSQQQYVNYYDGMGWMGMLDAINNESTYKIKTSVPCVVEMTGNETTSAAHPITIGPGWNWIGYPVNASMSVTTAMSGIIPTNGDQVKAQNGYANYYDGMGWMGTLSTIEPGMGILYKSNGSGSFSLTYPTGSKGEILAENITAEGNHWVPDMHAYPNNMTITAVVELDGEELQSENYELAAFANGECRGSVRLMYVEPIERHLAFLTIAGEEVETLTFSLYDTQTSVEIHGANEQINFSNNAIVSDLMEPYVIHFRGITGTDEWANNIHVFPNPVTRGENVSLSTTEEIGKVQIEVINTLGIVVETLRATSVKTIAAPNVAGVYTLRITAEGKGSCYRKLMVK